MNIFIQHQNKQLLSHNEQIIAKYIFKHPHEVLNMNSSQLAKACFVSAATIYRLCDKLTLSRFSELKVKISSSLQNYLKNDDDFDFNFPVNVPIEEYQQRLLAASSDNSHIAIIISFEGRGVLAGVLPQRLQENKTPIILISSLTYQIKNIKPDYQLYLSPKENQYKKISSFSTRLSLLYVLDVIYSSYFE